MKVLLSIFTIVYSNYKFFHFLSNIPGSMSLTRSSLSQNQYKHNLLKFSIKKKKLKNYKNYLIKNQDLLHLIQNFMLYENYSKFFFFNF